MKLVNENIINEKIEKEIIPLIEDYIKDNISDNLELSDFEENSCGYGNFEEITYTYKNYKFVIQVDTEYDDNDDIKYNIDTLRAYYKSYAQEKSIY